MRTLRVLDSCHYGIACSAAVVGRTGSRDSSRMMSWCTLSRLGSESWILKGFGACKANACGYSGLRKTTLVRNYLIGGGVTVASTCAFSSSLRALRLFSKSLCFLW